MKNMLDFSFGLSGLLGFIITIIVTIAAILKGDYSIEANIVILILAAFNVALAIVSVRVLLTNAANNEGIAALKTANEHQKKEIAQLIDTIRKNEEYNIEIEEDNIEIAELLHSIQDELRDRYFELYAALNVEKGEMLDKDINDLQRTNEMFYLFAVNNIKNIFDIISGDKCAVCIKILDVSDTDVIMVRTFIRDSTSYRERKASDDTNALYSYDENTAFEKILSHDYSNNYYVCDNLADNKEYRNKNQNWKNLYNATLVCPIRIRIGEERTLNKYSVLGFVCVDNMHGGLDDRKGIELLASISDSLYNHFSLFWELAPDT